ncbi:MAG: hypothetical protein ACI8T1_004997 [Verrucomicrobiales bacterium]|jgi:hypothetical protein
MNKNENPPPGHSDSVKITAIIDTTSVLLALIIILAYKPSSEFSYILV